MIAAAAQSKVMISTYHNRHWDGCIVEAMSHIRAGEIGEVYRIEAHMGGYGKPGDWWRTSKSISGGVMYDWGVHLLEYALQVMGDTAMTEVTGFAKTGYWAPQTAWPNDCNEDEGHAVVRFANGAWLTLNLTQLDSNPKRGMLEVTGTKGSYIMEMWHYELIQHLDGKVISTKGKNPPSEGWRYYQNVAEHLVRRQPLIVTGEFARRPIHVLDLAGQSARKGASLKTKYP
jgi:predicted dehydrogenase